MPQDRDRPERDADGGCRCPDNSREAYDEFFKNIVWAEPLASVPMPETLPPLDYWSLEEGRRRGYCK